MQSLDKYYKLLTNTLTLPDDFDEQLTYTHTYNLPNSLTIFIFGINYNQQILPDVLPQTLTHLIFNIKYNQPIGPNVLPKSLTHLVFGRYYNQPIQPNVLPKSLRLLKFNTDYNYKIEPNVLPQNLTHLEFGSNYNHQFDPNVLPLNLTHLTLGYNYEHTIKDILPLSCTTLKCNGSYSNTRLINNLPSQIQNLQIMFLQIPLNNLPYLIKSIQLIYYLNNTFELLEKIPYNCDIIDRTNNKIII
jgi:hypothetical protein